MFHLSKPFPNCYSPNALRCISGLRTRYASYVAVILTSALAVSAAALEENSEQPAKERVEEITIQGEELDKTASRFPLTARELPQSVSVISRELMDLNSITNLNELMLNVTGINVTLYDSQRPLYFSRGFQITDFQVDGVPTYSGSTNQEYDVALYESAEVIRGANGLLSGVGSPSATVNLIRKRPQSELTGSVTAGVTSWDRMRTVGDISVPLNERGTWRSRAVIAYEDGDSFRDRYREDKLAAMAMVEGAITEQTTVALGYQNQDNNPEGTIWGTIPIFNADGSEADMPVSASFAPTWTQWQRESGTLFANVEHRFSDLWNLRAIYNRTDGEVFSLRVYKLGYPDPETGAGTYLLAGVGATEDTRESLDVFVTGKYSAFGREHDLVFGLSHFTVDAMTPSYSSISDWTYDVPNAFNYDGTAPFPDYRLTGASRDSKTNQTGMYLATRYQVTEPMSFIFGGRLTSWDTGTENYNTEGQFEGMTGEYEVDKQITPYFGAVYDINSALTVYASYTDIFRPVNNKNKNNNLLEPVLGANTEVGIKIALLEDRLNLNAAAFLTKQDNYPVRDPEVIEDGSLPDGSSAFISVDGTESEGFEISIEGVLNPGWTINAGYTYVNTIRNENDRIWTNLPDHSIQLTTHYQFPGSLDKLTLGGGFNWQSETVGYGVAHPIVEEGVTYQQDSYFLMNLYANWQFSQNWQASFAATNLLDEKYWANIDYANYGEPQKVSLNLKWQF